MFTFLDHDGVPFDNNHAEREVRPAVIIRKNSYGNRSEVGADAQAVLMTVFRTQQRGHQPMQTIVQALRTYVLTGQLPQLLNSHFRPLTCYPDGSLCLSFDRICNLERTANMGKDATEIRTEFHTRLGQVARELSRELYPRGLPRGTKFSELEAVAGALGDEMARQLIEINVQEQADDWPEEELGECPVCGGAARKAPDEPRVLMTTRGDVAWKQRVGNCPRCRRAFFPSESSVGH